MQHCNQLNINNIIWLIIYGKTLQYLKSIAIFGSCKSEENKGNEKSRSEVSNDWLIFRIHHLKILGKLRIIKEILHPPPHPPPPPPKIVDYHFKSISISFIVKVYSFLFIWNLKSISLLNFITYSWAMREEQRKEGVGDI